MEERTARWTDLGKMCTHEIVVGGGRVGLVEATVQWQPSGLIGPPEIHADFGQVRLNVRTRQALWEIRQVKGAGVNVFSWGPAFLAESRHIRHCSCGSTNTQAAPCRTVGCLV